MLTREQARKQPCKPNDAIVAVAGVCVGLMSIITHSLINDASIASKCSAEVSSMLSNLKEGGMCTANDCPKWVDYFGKDLPMCSHRKGYSQSLSCTENEDCNDCPHRYGRCGG